MKFYETPVISGDPIIGIVAAQDEVDFLGLVTDFMMPYSLQTEKCVYLSGPVAFEFNGSGIIPNDADLRAAILVASVFGSNAWNLTLLAGARADAGIAPA